MTGRVIRNEKKSDCHLLFLLPEAFILFLNIVGVFINQWLLLTRMPAAESMARGSHRMRF